MDKRYFDAPWATPEEVHEGRLRQIYGPLVVCHFEGYPPLKGERCSGYEARVLPLILARPTTRWERFRALFG